MACLLVDTIKEMSEAPVHLSPLSSTDFTISFIGWPTYSISFESAKNSLQIKFCEPQLSGYLSHSSGGKHLGMPEKTYDIV